MGTPVLAAVLAVAGVVAAFAGLGMSVLLSRRREPVESGPAVRMDAGLVVLVTGLVVAILAGGDWVFLVLVL